MLKPGSTIGILGGGQLGRMLALSAARLGLHCHIYSPEKDSGAFEVVRASTCAAYEDEAALAKFAASVDSDFGWRHSNVAEVLLQGLG